MDTLRGIPEHIEAEFGDSIVARDEAVAVLGANAGLGPPDLCWLQKCQKRSILGGTTEAQGYYHYVLGRDVSSSAAVAAYFALLTSKVEPCGVLRGLWLTEWVIQRGFYCCYDPLSRMDLRCELCVPGGVVVGCVDAAGVLHDVTPQLWMQAQVCSFVRALLYDPEMRLNGGSVIAYEPCPTAAAERSLLSAVMSLYSMGSLPGALQDIYAEQGCGVLPQHMDVVLAALWQHFRRRQRWTAAADFFRQLAALYSPAALLLAAAQRQQGLVSSSGGLLAELLSGARWDCLVGLGHELLEAGRVEQAAATAREALQASPRCRPAWLLLAHCFIARRQWSAALVALNVVPTPPLPAAEVELLHVVPPPPPKATTHPQARLYDGELEGVRAQALEEASLDGSRLLAYLPGSILVNREPLGCAHTPDTSPNRITRSVLAAVYTLLQDIVSATSWDAFLEIRSRVFLMQHEATPRASSESVQQQQQQHRRQQQQQQQRRESQDQQQETTTPSATLTAVQQKLEQLGVQAHPHIPLHDAQSGVNGVAHSTDSPAPGVASAATATPPSRGRLSSSGGHRGSPSSYYASKLHDELAKPGTSRGISSSSGAATPAPHLLQQQHDVQQQQQPPATAPPAVGAAAAAPAGPPVPRVSNPAGDNERSMAGRVLLLGRTHARRISGSTARISTPPGSSMGVFGGHNSAAAVGCGVPRVLAANEVEDLSRLATASKVAPIRTQPNASITPQLWDVVFGAARSPPAAGSRRAVQQQQQQQHVSDVLTPTTLLPRIRTRPLAESREEEPVPAVSQASFNDSSSSWMHRHSSSSTHCSSLSAAGARCSCHHSSTSPASTLHTATAQCRSSSSKPGQQQCSRWLLGCLGQQQQAASGQCCFASSSSAALGPGPLAEGLDRSGSLLLRTSSVTSSVGAPSTARGLAGAGPSGNYGSGAFGSALADGGGSGNFGASLARRASLAGEAVSASLASDRQALVAGWIADDASAEMPGPDGTPGRRLCVRWLDELIVALWHDLQAYMEWKVWDQNLREARGGTHAELVLGLVPEQSDTPRTPVSDGGALCPPSLTAIDWMRRGALAERLDHVGDARAAYRASVSLAFNLTSYLALLRLEAQAGNVSDTLLCAGQVLSWHQQRLGHSSSSGDGSSSGGSSDGAVVLGVPPEVVSWGLGLVADSAGLAEVGRTSPAAGAAAQAAVKAVLEEWGKWQAVAVPDPLQLKLQ